MSYLGYKNRAFREYKREQERVKIWKIKQKAERKRLRERKSIYKATLAHVVIAIMLIALYSLVYVTSAKADTIKVGDGAFVMAVSYTESYDDLQYVANFPNCDKALDYYNMNCTNAYIMMCQLEDKLYMPISHETRNTFSTFDFEVDTKQSCGFVGVQKPKFTED